MFVLIFRLNGRLKHINCRFLIPIYVGTVVIVVRTFRGEDVFIARVLQYLLVRVSTFWSIFPL